MSEIVSLGLDISSFDDGKKARLLEYISIFERMEKYEGKVYNPVLGNGLTAFNTSIAETGKLLDDLNTKLNSLASTQTQTNNTTTKGTSGTISANKALAERNAIATKAAENETKLAAANTKGAQALLTKANAEARAATSALQNANSTNKAVLTSKNQEAAEKAVAAALAVRVQAEKQLIAANSQMSLAERQRATNTDRSTQAVKKLEDAVQAGKIATVNAAAAVESANAGLASSTQQLNLATNGAGGFSKALNGAFSQLRTLAYILPGLGIAGIFNIAFEAIGSVIEALGIFDNSVIKEIDRQIELNKAIQEEFDIRKGIQEQKNALFQSGSDSSTTASLQKDVLAAGGANNATLLNKEIEVAGKEFNEAKSKLPLGVKNAREFAQSLIESQDEIKQKREAILAIQNAKNENTSFFDKVNTQTFGKVEIKKINGKNIFYNPTENKKTLEEQKQELDILEKSNNDRLQRAQNFLNKESALNAAVAARNKFAADERRKTIVETGKDNADLKIVRAKQIVDSETTTLLEKEAAIKAERVQKDKKAKLDNFNTQDNRSSDGSDKSIDSNKLKNQLRENEIEQDKKLFDVRETYRQRTLVAQAEINKAAIEQEAIKNEKIANNDENSLDDRLVALAKYLDLKGKLQDEEFKKDKERLSLKSNDPAAQKELVALEATYKQQKASVSADAEKKAFDITTTALAKEYNEVKKLNEQNSADQELTYALEVDRINDLFKAKSISFEEYKKRNIEIDKKYKVKIINDDIIDKQQDISRLERLSTTESDALAKANQKVDTAEVFLQSAKDSGGDVTNAQKSVDLAKGERDAILKAQVKTNGDILKANDDLKKLFLKQSLAEREDFIAKEDAKQKKVKETFDVIFKIEKAIFDAAKKYSDATFKIKQDEVDERTATALEGYDAEIAAIEKSSLSQKDKAALDIQLTTQKQEIEKAAQVEQKRLRIEQAEFDKQLSIARIIFGTAEAVIAAGAITPQAIAAGIVGAIQLAVAIATPIPSFAEGVEDFEGGIARYGEAGAEVVKEPNKQPYLVEKETIGYLPKGTDVIPISKYHVQENRIVDSSWEQTMYLANQIKKSTPKITNKNIIKIDLGFTNYKREILGN